MDGFYTNVETIGDSVLLRGVENGKRFKRRIKYEPYFFEPTTDTASQVTLSGLPVRRIDFPSMGAARTYQKMMVEQGSRLYGLDDFAYVYIHDSYPGTIEFAKDKIRVAVIDIECYSDKGFPDPEIADQPITAISVRHRGHTVTYSTVDFYPEDPESQYAKCDDEADLLIKFLNFWRKIDLDVVTGWNIEFFDIPYLVNRIKRVLSDTHASKLSPWNLIRERTTHVMGRKQVSYILTGMAVLDYLQLYTKFAYQRPGQKVFKESKALNYVAHKELGEKKLDYSEHASLTDLWLNDPQKYLKYNIHDCYLVERLEEELKLIELVLTMAYDAKVNYTDALTSVHYWDIKIYHALMDQNIVIPWRTPKEIGRELEGAFVKEVTPGMYQWIVSLDLASLYPNLLIGYNISPETFLGKVHELTIDDLLEGKLPRPDDELCIAANGCAYRKDKQGFIPALMDKDFKLRLEYKSKLKDAKGLLKKIDEEIKCRST